MLLLYVIIRIKLFQPSIIMRLWLINRDTSNNAVLFSLEALDNVDNKASEYNVDNKASEYNLITKQVNKYT